ncbi:MAG: hypothetical protein H7329_07920 [Opitutaceae bacterium]|nr:hypothetical protein [Cytophagales bacterium]
MNQKKITDLFILCLTILLANILVEVITNWAGRYLKTENIFKTNAISMAVTVIVYYPAFKALNEFLKSSTKKYIVNTKKVAGGGFIGIMLAFIIALVLLFFINLKVRYDIDIIHYLLNK